MVLGTVLVLAALSLFLWNQEESDEAGEVSEEVLTQVVEQIVKNEAPPDDTQPLPDPYDETMTETEIDGYAYIGYLSIPEISLELPVMSQWDYTRLKIAPCRYVGSTKTGNLVICGHNYTRHLGPIKSLDPGDDVYFTDMDGEVWHYQVATVETLGPTDIESMTSGEYPLTLFTCTYGGATRVTVRCEPSSPNARQKTPSAPS